ncbi:hypothetical protein [Blackfly microvirus SF02]|uniref:Uncharacterized protein n=1 Tax=Blackfly microvirus SF02 TaxID=2576452 RepID=A0A4P8PKA2_9VIRU|nr:hypothetical protein [Blackfly microvirus SF02]
MGSGGAREGPRLAYSGRCREPASSTWWGSRRLRWVGVSRPAHIFLDVYVLTDTQCHVRRWFGGIVLHFKEQSCDVISFRVLSRSVCLRVLALLLIRRICRSVSLCAVVFACELL